MSVSKNDLPASAFCEYEFVSVITDSQSLASGYYGIVICNSATDITVTMGGTLDHGDFALHSIMIFNINTGVVTISGATESITVAQGASVPLLGYNNTWVPLRLQASGVLFDDSVSGIGVSNVQDAIDYINAIVMAIYYAVIEIMSLGWVDSEDDWEYVSSNQFKVAGDQRSKYSKGTPLKWTQDSTERYGNVSADPSYDAGNDETTISKFPGFVSASGDCDILDTATYPLYSNVTSKSIIPQDFPEWFYWSPTLDGFSSDPTGIYRFKVNGKECITCVAQTADGTSDDTLFSITSPVTSANITGMSWSSFAPVVENGSVVASPGMMKITYNSATIYVYKDASEAEISNTGGKRVKYGTLVFEY
jgi:hypothetical protein